MSADDRRGRPGTEIYRQRPGRLTTLSNLASIFSNQGRWKEAEQLEVEIMEARKTACGNEHPHTLVSMSNLASTYRYQGRWKEAELLAVQVVETQKRVLGQVLRSIEYE